MVDDRFRSYPRSVGSDTCDRARVRKPAKGATSRTSVVPVIALLLVTPLAGCADYLNRYDTVTLAAGDAQQQNRLIHALDPFNPASMDTRIPTDGQRIAGVAAKYRHGSSNQHGSSTSRDLDCAGGSGNNPVVAGPVSVSGADPNRLDGDGDGVGCER